MVSVDTEEETEGRITGQLELNRVTPNVIETRRARRDFLRGVRA